MCGHTCKSTGVDEYVLSFSYTVIPFYFGNLRSVFCESLHRYSPAVNAPPVEI